MYSRVLMIVILWNWVQQNIQPVDQIRPAASFFK